MALFHPLKVVDLRHTIRDAIVVTLAPQATGNFDFEPGQFLTFRTIVDGTELRRSYSICAGKGDGVLQVAIKRVEGGAFSNWANDNLAPGTTIEAMEPAGNFRGDPHVAAGKSYLAFAGGSGITPVMSILKTVLAQEPGSQFTLVYANRGVHTIMFREELEDLKNLYMGRLTLIHVLESEALDIELFKGRVDQDKCRQLFDQWINLDAIDTAYICGPEPMMLGIAAALQDHGMAKEQIRYELFTSAQPGRLARKAGKAAEQSERASTVAQITIDGTARTVTMDKDQSLLQAALDNMIDAPYACRAGVCSTCKCRVLSGEVEMVANHALEDYEVERGYVLSCQSYPITDHLAVEYEH